MSEQSVPKAGQSEAQACPQKAVEFIRRLYPTKTADSVAFDTGIPAPTVRRWMEGASSPSWVAFSRLILAYGPAFLAAVFPRQPRWLTDAYQRERLAELEAEQARIQSKIQALKAQP